MIQLILFDLDGVLITAKNIHFKALNLALGPDYEISLEDHHGKFDGLPTKIKLDRLTIEKGLPLEYHDDIWKKKQQYTLEMFSKELERNPNLVSVFRNLKEQGLLIGCCSNSIRRSIYTALTRTGIIDYFDIIVSAEDVKQPKPYPEMYWKAMSEMKCLPENTLIVEDNPNGLIAAYRSNVLDVMRVKSPSDVTSDKLFNRLRYCKQHRNTMTKKWENKKLNVLIPMAGAGSRFVQAGYTFPKPLIDVGDGRPMIQMVVENLQLDANYIFVCQKEHREKYNLDALLALIAPDCSIIETDGVTEGAACTALLARDILMKDPDAPLFFANSDQYVEWNPFEFMYRMQESNVDGGIVIFTASHPKWSYAKIDDAGFVTEVAEKKPISNLATVGFYYWKRSGDFVKYADQMIEKDIRVNNEFYVCPVFNQAIEDGKKIRTFPAMKMYGTGTPEDLEHFISAKRNQFNSE